MYGYAIEGAGDNIEFQNDSITMETPKLDGWNVIEETAAMVCSLLIVNIIK